jgi:hypothetical protein
VATEQKIADLVEAGNLGVYLGKKFDSVHADECNSVIRIFLIRPLFCPFG